MWFLRDDKILLENKPDVNKEIEDIEMYPNLLKPTRLSKSEILFSLIILLSYLNMSFCKSN